MQIVPFLLLYALAPSHLVPTTQLSFNDPECNSAATPAILSHRPAMLAAGETFDLRLCIWGETPGVIHSERLSGNTLDIRLAVHEHTDFGHSRAWVYRLPLSLAEGDYEIRLFSSSSQTELTAPFSLADTRAISVGPSGRVPARPVPTNSVWSVVFLIVALLGSVLVSRHRDRL